MGDGLDSVKGQMCGQTDMTKLIFGIFCTRQKVTPLLHFLDNLF